MVKHSTTAAKRPARQYERVFSSQCVCRGFLPYANWLLQQFRPPG
ncbi:hypothetical protein VSS37_19315 [Candidatus Thiothrix sp. Deng01]|uniref:Uncharacterized protein n=1 Tax=Candidatus Thiothrix phosphatis TaxID=3112415 RepID=A0ABU6D496_9GAMM|nr:hypothetical protein [Candidatus Thiothrix sp. Deng01]MEB4593137.1 hypothetical protein [Candidatus Thiothrix sp. Deng01]